MASIRETRAVLTQTLQRLQEDAKSAALVRDMRVACHAFFNTVEHLRRGRLLRSEDARLEFSQALGELRGVFGMNLAVLTDKFGIEVHGPLSTILPADSDVEE
jgi:hypothetical protein